jgi:hypothetical protein
MKSKLDEAKVKTSCKDCAFAKYKDDTQVACLAGRISAFGNDAVEVYDLEKEFYVIARSCNMFRLKSWNSGDADVDKARKEIEVPFSFVIETDSLKNEDIDSIASGLSAVSYDKQKIQIIISQPSSKDHNVAFSLFETMKSAGFNPIIVKSLHRLSRSFDLLLKCRGLYVSVISSNVKIPKEAFLKVDNGINLDLKSPAVIDIGEWSMMLTSIANSHILKYKGYSDLFKDVSEEALKEDKHIKIHD